MLNPYFKIKLYRCKSYSSQFERVFLCDKLQNAVEETAATFSKGKKIPFHFILPEMPIKTELKMQIKKSFQVDLFKNSNEIKWELDRVFETRSESHDVVTRLFWSNVK